MEYEVSDSSGMFFCFLLSVLFYFSFPELLLSPCMQHEVCGFISFIQSLFLFLFKELCGFAFCDLGF